MMGTPARVERVTYQPGNLLAGRDLAAAADYESRMRALHVQAVHRAFGVALGYEVMIARDGTKAYVGPGLAYDQYGREILSSRTVTLYPPAAPVGRGTGPWWFHLVIAEGGALPVTAGCGCDARTDSPCPSTERPAWRWMLARNGGLAVARFVLTASGLFGGVELSNRPVGAPAAPFRVAHGRVAPGDVPIEGGLMSWSARIDTSIAAFSRVPYYFVSLPTHPLSSDSLHDGVVPTLTLPDVVGPFVTVSAADTTYFEIEVRIAAFESREVQGGDFSLPPAKQVLPVPVDWIGVEPAQGAAPPFDVPVPQSDLPAALTRVNYIHLRGTDSPSTPSTS